MAERIWQKSYAEGIPFEIEEGGYASIAELFSDASARVRDLVA